MQNLKPRCTVKVIPRIQPEGKVRLRLEPIISIPNPKPVDPDGGHRPPTINVETQPSTGLVSNGETLVLHGLTFPQLRVSKFGSLRLAPNGKKGELLFILTPSVVQAKAPVVGRPETVGR
jgi:hypothetical protein